MKVTKELIKEFEDYCTDIYGEYDDDDIQEALNTLKENEGKELYKIDYAIVTRIIFDRPELYKKISQTKEQEIGEKNVFE